ncbi:ABC-type nitrate/sulfonate/bicarbonate transport system substrate-binding protein [Limnobacter thiooxidans]|uniref:ABC transporter substrate-binding protein n=1 Tax=Limnobacter thiooxidans TaxID=131080 RepID=A0AA86M902_9BURK|nr:ABC-type nitrate/sulfonate/bicarbonate transport system substrate-binding protein [Limnobacter thiooxidans]BET26984.1 ABC transporter substrate-binding protein [Limnobacter thiooxidans]
MTDRNQVDTLWYTRCPVPTPLGLASRLGWFNQEFGDDGITIKTLQDTGDASTRESHYDHHLPHSFRQGGNVPAIWAKARGADTIVIGLNWIDEAQLIVSLKDSGIEKPSDLRGKRLALPVSNNSIDHARAGALRGLLVTLEVGGVNREEVNFIDVQSGQGGAPGQGWANSSVNDEPARTRPGAYESLFQALKAGEVDAIFVKGARGLEAAETHGVHIVYDIRQHPSKLVRANNGAPRPITVDRELLETRPDIVQRFLQRIVAIGEWAKTNQKWTIDYIARESGSTAEWVQRAYGPDAHLHQGTDLDPQSIEALSAYKDFLLKEGFIAADFDVHSWINPEPLKAVLAEGEQQAA